ncbi:MAG: hypothetical protein RSF87_07925, partial [Cellulosilyticaceae bacterium]
NSGLEILLLEDQHPMISRSDLGYSLYLNSISMFAIKEPANETESSCYLFLESGAIKMKLQLFSFL